MLERPVDIVGVDLMQRGPERHAAAELFAKDLKADYQIGQHHAVIAMRGDAANARRRRPGQKFGITRHISHKRIHLLWRIGQRFGLGVMRHVVRSVLCCPDVGQNAARGKGGAQQSNRVLRC